MNWPSSLRILKNWGFSQYVVMDSTGIVNSPITILANPPNNFVFLLYKVNLISGSKTNSFSSWTISSAEKYFQTGYLPLPGSVLNLSTDKFLPIWRET